MANIAMVAVGLTLLALFFTAAVFDSLEAMLLAIGSFLVGSLRRIRDEAGEAQAKRLGELRRAAPVLVYVSIGLSISFFGKDVIFSIGVARLRPIMMSVSLQALGVLTYSKLRPSRE